MWLRHWSLARDPFSSPESPYVPTAAHDEAVARLVYAIEAAQPLVVLAAEAGVGKSAALRQALAVTAEPPRRTAMVSCPAESAALWGLLAERLGERADHTATGSAAWRALERAIRLAGLHGLQIVLAIDDCDERIPERVRRDVAALAQLRATTGTSLTVIQAGRDNPFDASASLRSAAHVIRLKSLTRADAERYLKAKLAGAGCVESIFTPRAVTALHGLSRGVPRELEQLAALCLHSAAGLGLEAVSREVVDAVIPAAGNGASALAGAGPRVSG